MILSSDIDKNGLEAQKLVVDKYYEVIKLRGAQVLTLFIAYGLALRDSKYFMDAGSFLSIVIPLAAWFLDMVARRHYGAPLAYAMLEIDYGGTIGAAPGVNYALGRYISDFGMRHDHTLSDIFEQTADERCKREKFYTWYTFRDQKIPSLVFLLFCFMAIFITT